MADTPREHHEHFLVRSYEVEPDGRLRLVVLLRMLQEAAWQHANLLGKGFHHRQEGALFWVLSRLRLRMNRYPRWGDQLTIRTFPVGTQKLFALREFSLHADDGTLLGRASSAWLVVDASRGRPIRPQPVVADIVTTESEFSADLERIPAFENDADTASPPDPYPGRADLASAAAPRPGAAVATAGPVPVRYHDIDQYRHVNNAAYLEWVLDALDPARPMGSVVTELALDFLKETVLEDAYQVRLRAAGATDHFQVDRHSGAGRQADPPNEIVDPPAPAEPEAAVRGYLTWRPLE